MATEATERMKVLVTGANGFVGSFLCPGLEAAGYEVVPYDLKDGQDIFNGEQLSEALAGCDAVVHMAAIPHYSPTIPPQEYIRLNVYGTEEVLWAADYAGIRQFVYISSGALYGFGTGRMDGWTEPTICTDERPESADWDSIDIYGASKLLAEDIIDDFTQPFETAVEWLETNIPVAEELLMNCVSLRLNCIEPHHEGAKDQGHHWGWWCSQELITNTVNAALGYDGHEGQFTRVNVAEPNENMGLTDLYGLLGGVVCATT